MTTKPSLQAKMKPTRLETLTAAAFAPGGALSHAIRNFAHNRNQAEYAAKVARLIAMPAPKSGETGAIAMLEGETGLGKTIAYLVPLMLNAAITGERAFISTHTNHLGLQILQTDGPIAANVVARSLGQEAGRPSIGWRFGRRNFFDRDRTILLARAASEEGHTRLRKELMAWADVSPTTFIEASEIGLALPEGVSESDVCLLASSNAEVAEAYNEHVARSREADIMVTNHALSLLNAQRWTHLLDSTERPACIGIFDEADALPAAAQSLSQPKTSLHALGALIAGGGNGKRATEAAENLELVYKAIGHLEEDGPVVIDRTRQDRALLRATRALADSVSELARNQSCQTREDLKEAVAAMRSWLDATDDGSWTIAVVSRSPVRKFPSLVTVQVNPGSITGRLWRRFGDGDPYLRATLLTSATLARPSSSRHEPANFSEFKRYIAIGGKDRHLPELSGRFEVEAFGKMSFVLADRKAPCPTMVDDDEAQTNPTWIDYVTRGVIAAHERGGRVLVLTTSYEDAEALGTRIPEAICQSRGEKIGGLIDKYRSTEGSILITPTAWNGVNLPGLVNHLVIPRIPFEPPDPEKNTVLRTALIRLSLNDETARRILAGRSHGRTERKLRQGIGRAIRSSTDQATLWILDPRFPLPDAMIKIRKLRLHQGLAERHTQLLACIPYRFRIPPSPAIERAEIFSVRS
jgi:ATP-dependent DNA helicase DinG